MATKKNPFGNKKAPLFTKGNKSGTAKKGKGKAKGKPF